MLILGLVNGQDINFPLKNENIPKYMVILLFIIKICIILFIKQN